MESSIQAFLQAISIPWVGLTSVGVMAFLSATILPLSSEAAFFLYLVKFPENMWTLIVVASLGNTLGGVFNWQIGFFAKNTKDSISSPKIQKMGRISTYLHQFGSKSLLFSWVPIIGDPLAVYAGWSKWPFWSCCLYLAIGKTVRYIVIAYFYVLSNSSTGL